MSYLAIKLLGASIYGPHQIFHRCHLRPCTKSL